MRCNHNCFECPFPDVPDECLEAPLTRREIVDGNIRDRRVRTIRVAESEDATRAARVYWSDQERERATERQLAQAETTTDDRREARRVYNRQYYEDNKTRLNARRHEWYLENRERILAQQKEYRRRLKEESENG